MRNTGKDHNKQGRIKEKIEIKDMFEKSISIRAIIDEEPTVQKHDEKYIAEVNNLIHSAVESEDHEDHLMNSYRYIDQDKSPYQIKRAHRERIFRKHRATIKSNAKKYFESDIIYKSLTELSKNYGLTAYPEMTNHLSNLGLLTKSGKRHKLTKKGEGYGGKYNTNSDGSQYPVWNEVLLKPILIAEKKAIINKLNFKSIIHMTHLENLESILGSRLFCHSDSHTKFDISNQDVNAKRVKKETVYNNIIHDYVPFYFNAKNAMLYQVQHENNDNVILMSYNKNTLLKERVIFSDRNAASDNTIFTSSLNDVETFDWPVINSREWSNNGTVNTVVKSKMMSECLIYKSVENEFLDEIYCQSQQAKINVDEICKRTHTDIRVSVKPELFFNI